MATDPNILKEINKVIKLLLASGKEMSNKSRELMTFIYAVKEGFIETKEDIQRALEDVQNGKWEGPNLGKTLKTLKLTDDVIDDIVKKRRELEKLDDTRIKFAKSEYDLLDLIYGVEQDRYDLSTKNLTLFEELSKQLSDQHRLVRSSGVAMGSNTDILVNQIRKHSELSKIYENQFLPTDEIQDHLNTVQGVMDNITAKSFDIKGLGEIDTDSAVSALGEISKKQIALIGIEDQIRRRTLKQFAADSLKKSINLDTGQLFDSKGSEIINENATMLNSKLDTMVSKYEDMIRIINEQGDLTDDIKKTISEVTYEHIKQAAAQQKFNTLASQQLDITSRNLSILLKYRPAIRAATSAGDALADTAQKMIDVLPEGLQRFLGMQNSADGIRESTQNAIQSFNTNLVKTGSASKAVKASIGEWGAGLSKSVGIVGGIVLALTAMYKLTQMIEGNYQEISDEMGISLTQAKALYKANLDIVSSQKNQFLMMKDIQAVQAAYIQSTGQVFDMASEGGQKMALELGEMSKLFGYSNEHAVELYEVFSQLGADKKFANSLQRQLGFVSEMAGLSPKIVSQDLIEGAEAASTYFAGMPEAAGKATIAIRRMGLTLKKAGEIAKSMMNLEGFMENMFELAAMGGPDISAAFDLGLSGDLEGMTKEIMNAIGTAEDFAKMDYFQREKLAKTLNMSTDELSKSLMLRQKLVGMSEEEKALVESNLDSFGNIAGMDQDAIRARLAQVKSTERLNVAWEKIKAVLIKSLLPIAEGFADALEGISPLVDGLIVVFKGLGAVINVLAVGVKWLLAPLTWIKKLVDSISGAFGTTEKAASGVKVEMASMGMMLTDMLKFSAALGGAWLLGGGKLLKFIFTLGGILPRIGKLFTGIGSSIGDMAKGADKTSESFGGLFSKIKKPKWITSMLDGIKDRVGSLLGMSKKAGKEGVLGKVLGTGTESPLKRRVGSGALVRRGTGSIGQGAADTVKTGGGRITGALKSVTDVITTAMRSMGNILKTGFTTVGSVVKTGLTVVGGIIKTGITQVIEIAKSVMNGLGGIIQTGAKVVKTALSGLKGIIFELTDIITGVLKKVASGLGDVIKSLLVKLGEGLASFSPKAAVGAASLVIVAGALWLTAEAVQNFASVNWGDMGKAGAALIGLATIAAVLGSLAGNLIIGAAALAIMGAALIPAAFALGMFSKVSWDDLAKAGVAIIGLSAAIGILGGIMMSGFGAAVILAGAAALAVMGASLLPLAIAVKKLSDANLPAVGTGLKSLGAGLVELMGISFGGNISEPIIALTMLGHAVQPIEAAAKAVQYLGESIAKLSEALESADFSKLSEFEKLKGIAANVGINYKLGGEGARVAVQPPPASMTAQNVSIREGAGADTSTNTPPDPVQEAIANSQSGGSNRNIESLLKQLIIEMQGINRRPMILQFDDGTMKTINYRLKGQNNNR